MTNPFIFLAHIIYYIYIFFSLLLFYFINVSELVDLYRSFENDLIIKILQLPGLLASGLIIIVSPSGIALTIGIDHNSSWF